MSRSKGWSGRALNADRGSAATTWVAVLARTGESRSGQLVEKEIDRSNPTVPGDDEIGSRVCRWFAGSARYPSNPSGITQFLGREEGPIFEIWMCCFYHTSNPINLVTTAKYTAFGVIEYCVLVENRIDCSAATHGVIFAKYVAQITKQQGRYAWTSCSPFQIVGREPPDLN